MMQKFPGSLSFVAAACLLANISAYAGRSHSYAGRKTTAKKSAHTIHHLRPIKPKKHLARIIADASYPVEVVPRLPLQPMPVEKVQRQILPLTPRIFAEGTLASQGFAYADGMVPVIGNLEGFAFIDGTGKWGTDNGWLGALGTGLREIWRGVIFGGYLFGEYDRTALENNYWMLNPGLEMMTPHWDVRINGYLPLGDRENINAVYFGSQLGRTCPTFKGRQQFDQVYNDVNEVAPGLDAQIGYIIPNLRRTRVFGGGYYYFFNHAPEIHGLVGGVELPLNQTISLLFRDSYDNVNRNTALLTLRVYLGGVNKVDENDIHERLLDPMERHIGVLYTGSGIPAEQVLYDTGQLKLQRDNIWFFRPGSTPGDTAVGATSCTYENPCNSDQFNQINVNNINGIAPLANFYLAEGSPNYFIGPLFVNSGQSIYGRTAEFCRPGAPILLGNLNLQGNNTLQAFQLIQDGVPPNHPTANVGITMANAPNITIDHVQIGPSLEMSSFASLPAGTFRTGINMNNAQNVLITASVINAGDVQANTFTSTNGIISQNSSSFTLDKSTINVHQIATATTTRVVLPRKAGAAVYLLNNSLANLYDNTIKVLTDGVSTIAGANPNPGLLMRSMGVGLVNYTLRSSSVLNSKRNRMNLTTYMIHPAGTTTGDIESQRNDGFYIVNQTPGDSVITSKGDELRTSNVVKNFTNRSDVRLNSVVAIYNSGGSVLANVANGYFNLNDAVYARIGYANDDSTVGFNIQASRNSTTRFYSGQNNFVANLRAEGVTAGNGFGVLSRNHRAISVNTGAAPGVPGTIAKLDSTGDTFTFNVTAINNNSTTGRAYVSFNNGIFLFENNAASDHVVRVNTTGDTFNLNMNSRSNGRADTREIDGIRALAYTAGSPRASVILTSKGDTFNINTYANGRLLADASEIDLFARTTGGTPLVVNLEGDMININVNAVSTVNAVATAGGVRADGSATTINLRNGDIFRFRVRRNGVPGTVTFKRSDNGGVITDDGTTKFLVY